MSPKICVRMAGTRTGKLRARVEQKGKPHFEVTLGGEKWNSNLLTDGLKERILTRARLYVDALDNNLHSVEVTSDMRAEGRPSW